MSRSGVGAQRRAVKCPPLAPLPWDSSAPAPKSSASPSRPGHPVSTEGCHGDPKVFLGLLATTFPHLCTVPVPFRVALVNLDI